jgi:DNA-directed RNA polymerase specialized sigma24 family protein
MGAWDTTTLAELEDVRFVRRLIRRDATAFEQLYDDLSPTIYGFLLETANAQDAEKALVETFYRAWSQLPAFVGERAALPGWLAGIAADVLNREIPGFPRAGVRAA